MRKCIFAFALLCSLGASAQLVDGFYHFRNTVTGRYISLNDANPNNYEPNLNSGDVNMAGIRTYLNYDTVAVSPSCVFYAKKSSEGKYDISCQGTSLSKISGGRFTIDVFAQGDDVYRISGTYKGIEKWLSDGSPSEKDSWLMNRLTTTRDWKACPINTTDEYVGIRPEVKTADGEFYSTIYAGFAFRLASPGLKAFYISKATGNAVTMVEVGMDEIPASIPVVIKCNSSDPTDNKIEPVIDIAKFSKANCLRGVYCALSGVAKHTNVTPYDPSTMRVIGLDSEGKLAFVKAKDSDLYNNLYLRANKAYLLVGSEAADVMTATIGTGIETIQTDDTSEGELYMLNGVRVSSGTVTSPGIYIHRQKDGTSRKVIVK